MPRAKCKGPRETCQTVFQKKKKNSLKNKEERKRVAVGKTHKGTRDNYLGGSSLHGIVLLSIHVEEVLGLLLYISHKSSFGQQQKLEA